MGLKETILQAPNETLQSVEAFGTTLYIRNMSGAERDSWELEAIDKNNRQNIRAKLLVRCLADENGQRLFSDQEAAQLGNKDGKTLDMLFTRAMKKNGIGEKDMEEISKN